MAALTEGNKVHVLDTSTGKENFQLDFGAGQGRSLIFTPDGSRLVIIDNRIRWCASDSGQVIASVDREASRALPADGQTPAAGAVMFAYFLDLGKAVSADGLTLAVVGHGVTGNQFSIFRLDAAKRIVTPLAKDVSSAGTLSAGALSADGRLLAVGARLSGSVSLYDTVTGRQIAQHGSAHASPVSAMAFAGDGFKLVTADVDGTIKVWEDARKLTSTSAAAKALKGHEAAITHVGFSSTGRQLVSTSADKTARVWDMDKSGLAVRALERSGSGCYAARFSADGQWIAAADGPSVRLWDAATGKLVRELSSGGKGRVFSVAFSPTDSRLLAVGYGGQTDVSYVALWDIDASRELARLPGATDLADFSLNENTGAVGALAFSPDGKYLVAGFGSPGVIAPNVSGMATIPLKVWEVATRRLIRRLIGHGGFCVSLDFSRDGARLASGSRDGTAILWSTATWKATRTLRNADADSIYSSVYSQPGMVEDAVFAPDGKSLAMASREGTVQLFDVATGGLHFSLKGHSSAVSAVAFSPDGRTLATGGSDQTIRLWNAETGRELMQMDFGDALMGGVETLAFSPDGRQLLAGGKSTAIWSAAAVVWNDPDRAALKLRSLLQSNALFQSRIRMLSENPRLHEALAKLDAKDVRVRAAAAALEANGHASRQSWPEAARAFDRLRAADPTAPEAWLRTPGLLRLATALLHANRPREAAALLSGGAKRRAQDGLPDVEQAGAGAQDAATGDLLGPLQALIKERLGQEPRNPGLLELRAELAGQWSDTKAQLADYTAAIEALSRQTPEPTADLGRLYGRRGDAHVALGQWQPAVEDYARGVTDATTDLALLSHQALALYQIHGDPQAILRLVERHPKLAGFIGDLFIQDKDKEWSLAVEIYSRGITPETTDALLLSKRAKGHEALKNWDAAVADWSRVAAGNPDGARLLQEFGRRLAKGGQVPLANDQFEKARALHERLLKSDAENDVVAAELAQLLVYQHENAHPTRWTVLEPTEMKSSGGATLTLKPDRSILVGGKNPDKDVYTLAAKTDLEHISAIQLETLCDPSLPSNGPGRYFGDFHLDEFRVFSAGQPAPLSNISVAYNRTREPLENIRDVIDGKLNDVLGWGNCAGLGKTNTAVIATQLDRARNDDLKVVLDFLPSCGLGCFRLSVSGDPVAFEREEKRFSVTQLTDPWSRLAAAYAINGRNQLALEYFGKAFGQADGYEARKPILKLLARFDDLLLTFVRQQREDPQLQLALAQTLAARGQQRLAAKQPEEALKELQQSRAIFTRLRASYPDRWTVLAPAELESTGGETMTAQSDGSIFVSGPNPERAVYTLKGRTDLPEVKAIRLETIPDARLPQGGAGRYSPSGNFHVSEFTAATESDGKKSEPTPIDISSATADYQLSEMFAPRNMIDGNPRTRWDTDNGGAMRRRSHWAIFGLNSPVRTGGGYLSITLDSGITNWGHHGLGRFRLSVTNEEEAIARCATSPGFQRKRTRGAERGARQGLRYAESSQ